MPDEANHGHDKGDADMDESSDLADLDRFSFGDGPEMADQLLHLVLAGTKTATCGAVDGVEPVRVGSRSVVLDGGGRPRALIETLEVQRRRFCDVDEAFARDEGEGDRTLASWREAHADYFARNGGFSDDMELWCERFRLVRALPDAEALSP
jgi:uncharacterized protein YhfF